MRLLVCGSRNWSSQAQYHRVADEILGIGPSLVMHGGAMGADECADLCCRTPPETIPLLVFRANWEADGKAAGPVRNARMLADGKPTHGLAFGALWRWDARKSKWKRTGTGDMVARMLKVKLPVRWVATADAPAANLVTFPHAPLRRHAL